MRKLIIGALMAAAAIPAAAGAQYQGDPQQRDSRGDRPGGWRDQRHPDQRHPDQGRRDFRDDRGDRDRAWGRDDWRGWRDRNAAIYARGNWRAPFRYQVFRPGVRIAPAYFGPRFWVVDPWRYHLPPARPGTRWVRHYDDVLLIDPRRGIVLDVIRGFYR